MRSRIIVVALMLFLVAGAVAEANEFPRWWPWLYRHGIQTDSNTVSIVTNTANIASIQEWIDYGGYASLWELGYDGVDIYAQISQYTPGPIGGYFQIDSSFVMTAQTNLVFDSIFTTNAAGHIIIRTIDP